MAKATWFIHKDDMHIWWASTASHKHCARFNEQAELDYFISKVRDGEATRRLNVNSKNSMKTNVR